MGQNAAMIFGPQVPLKRWIIVRLVGYFVVAVVAALAYGTGLAIYNAISGDQLKSAVPSQPGITETSNPSLAPSERNDPVLLPEGPPMAMSKDVVPKEPSAVVGKWIFDTENRRIGRVITVNTAPVFTDRQGETERKASTVFIVVQDERGTRHTIEYGNIKWKAASTKNVPEWGVITASSANGDGR
jgi:hypothetical protein